MRDEKRESRQTEIESAAYELFMLRGFAGTSMLEIAKLAKASNETLYRWYGDKNGLFAAMVERNAAGGLERLTKPLTGTQTCAGKLKEFGTALLVGILSDKAIALNKAAAADMTGELGAILSRHGRESVVPILTTFFQEFPLPNFFADYDKAVEVYLSLLIGDLQARRLLGRLKQPDTAFCKKRSINAVDLYLIIAEA
ncbi:MAG: TetR/AcrR family transcriptional regulator [bacterium]|nr:TetR/AcrR family transcriptional regulator [bacterium]